MINYILDFIIIEASNKEKVSYFVLPFFLFAYVIHFKYFIIRNESIVYPLSRISTPKKLHQAIRNM